MERSTVIVAAVSDVHAGGTTSPCPPEGVRFDDGGRYIPSVLQVGLWDYWNRFWDVGAKLRRQHKAKLVVLSVGDAVDGPGHHDTHQSISPNNAEAQNYVIERVFSVPRALKPDRWVFIKGTPVHVGPGADSESSLARVLGADRHPTTEAWSWYRWKARINGVTLDATHHGRSGGRPWTSLGAAGNLVSELIQEHVEAGLEPPDIALRAHRHTPLDTGDHHRTRLLMTPSWQMLTEHGYRVVPEKSVSVRFGGLYIVIPPDGDYFVKKVYFRPDPDPEWTI